MKKENYLFHIIIAKSMNNMIITLIKELSCKKFSKLIDFMLNEIGKDFQILKKIIGDNRSQYALIDKIEKERIDKYFRLTEKNYKLIKKWHYKFNEFSMAGILRDIIIFFYKGVIKYGVKKFLKYISGRINFKMIRDDVLKKMTHMIDVSEKKRLLITIIIENLPVYT